MMDIRQPLNLLKAMGHDVTVVPFAGRTGEGSEVYVWSSSPNRDFQETRRLRSSVR
jgi:hypothetical protein